MLELQQERTTDKGDRELSKLRKEKKETDEGAFGFGGAFGEHL
jgi:hypothetical protein